MTLIIRVVLSDRQLATRPVFILSQNRPPHHEPTEIAIAVILRTEYRAPAPRARQAWMAGCDGRIFMRHFPCVLPWPDDFEPVLRYCVQQEQTVCSQAHWLPNRDSHCLTVMARSKKKKDTKTEDPNARTVCRNRKARHEYEVLDEVDCGIELYGSEVKSIRNSKVSIEESFARVMDGEVWLMNSDIAEYPQASVFNHERRRRRKLLLHKREIRKFAEAGEQKGLTLVPLAVFLNRGFVKVKLGLCRGRQLHDKREKLKKQTDRREMDIALKRR